MLAVIATIVTQPGKGDAFVEAFKGLAAAVRAEEPGNSLYQLCRVRGEADSFKVIELYADDAAFEAHGKGEAFRTAVAALGGLVAGPPQVEKLDTV